MRRWIRSWMAASGFLAVLIPSVSSAQVGTCYATVHNAYSGAVTISLGGNNYGIASGGSVQVPISGSQTLCVWSCVWNGVSWNCGWPCPATARPGSSHTVYRTGGPPEELSISTDVAGFMGPVDFTPPSPSSSTSVSLTDNSPGSTAWYWDFGDGSTSTAQSPQHDYNATTPAVPPCHQRTFTVKHWAGVGQACIGPVSKSVSVYNTPTLGSAGHAYVIVGDVRAAFDPFGTKAALIEEAAIQAASRLQQSGYTVTRLGSATGGPYATASQFTAAIGASDATAVWVISHGPTDNDLKNNTDAFKMGDRWVDAGEIAPLRNAAGTQALKELTLFVCNGAAASPLSNWNLANQASVFARSRLVPSVEANVREYLGRCDSPPAPAPFYAARPQKASTLMHATSQAEYMPLLLMNHAGVLGDVLYGTVAGSAMNPVADGTGHASFANDTVGVSGVISGMATGDTARVWMNRYTSMPADTVPAGRSAVVAFLVGGGVDPVGAQLSFKYEPGQPADPTRLEVWRFDDSLRVFTQLSTAVDSVAHIVTAQTNRWGTFLVANGPSTTGVGSPSFPASFSLALRGNPVVAGSPLQLGFSVPSSGRATLCILDVVGALVATIFDGETMAGPHVATWTGQTNAGQRAAAGVYFVSLEAAGARRTAPLVVLH